LVGLPVLPDSDEASCRTTKWQALIGNVKHCVEQSSEDAGSCPQKGRLPHKVGSLSIIET
jgi:hypothetical protein